MSGLRGHPHHPLATPLRVTVRPLTLAIAALLAVALIVLTIVLATNAGSGDEQSGYSKSVRVTPSAPLPPSPAQRNQPPGLNGPGMRP